MVGYCMHCKERRPMNNKKTKALRKNKYSIRGTCNECGHTISFMVNKETYEKEKRFEQIDTI